MQYYLTRCLKCGTTGEIMSNIGWSFHNRCDKCTSLLEIKGAVSGRIYQEGEILQDNFARYED